MTQPARLSPSTTSPSDASAQAPSAAVASDSPAISAVSSKTSRHAALAGALLLGASLSPQAMAQDSFSVCWSVYAGWMPWEYADTQGIVDKWAKKYDINIDVVQVNDYVESINQYTSGNVDGCAMTNMDALTLPAASSVDSTALILGDYSDGNDGVMVRDGDSIESLKDREVNLVQFSVSHYLLARALDSVGMSERDLTTTNTGDADIVALASNPDTQAVVTWNPQLATLKDMPGYTEVFNSSDIPGEILDLMVVNTQTLKDNPDFGHALVGAWYEVMEKMKAGDEAALSQMADAAGTDLAGYQAQLAATHMYYTPAEAVAAFNAPSLKDTMQHIADFSFAQGLLGEGAPDAGFIGIETPAGVVGDEGNVMLRFDPSYTAALADSQ
ncbi:putative urea ABC transporter substrate-binding protein [Cobetia marina]|uniref:putative urea ABC transporter substrate-binding protein n=1 Tax=Cobetia marina TaxID=28258 RepID=UPI001C310670